jgi:phosphoribosylformylglycinamidine synthase PurS subunit
VRARVEIHLKKGVADPEGENVLKALKLLGFSSVSAVRSIKVFEIDLGERSPAKARASVEEMCRKLLANPVIHDSRIEIESARTATPAGGVRGKARDRSR